MSDSFGAQPPEPPPPPAPPPLPPQPPLSLPPVRANPWEERARLGIAAALVETIKQVLLSPVEFFKAMPVTGGLGGPLAFGMIVGYFGLAVSAIYQAVFRTLVGDSLFDVFSRNPALSRYAAIFQGGASLVVELAFGPVLLLIGLFLGAGITHLCLMLLGGAKRGFEATFRVSCFIQAVAVFSLLPFCGSFVHLVYQVVLAIVGISEAHGIGKGTAAVAVLLPGIVLCCCCVGIVLAVVGGIASLGGIAR